MLKVPVIDHWWQTESGWPMSSNLLGIGEKIFLTKKGSVFKPVPGYNIQIVDDSGNQLGPNTLGNIVVKCPLPPGFSSTLFKNHKLFIKTYLSHFPGSYETGDAGYIDEEGYLYVMARTDDIINVSGIRLSTGALEEVIATHRCIAESAVVGLVDDDRGEVPVALVVFKDNFHEHEELVAKEIVALVRDHFGAVAYLKGLTPLPFPSPPQHRAL
eukprot:TRINITY_DN6647_c0_g3_i11.p1 TRINITY_DN6647_c0_g3~~TRINITY_DN6647_c0_g3_i11.p1  ORF type:complete len:214 (-),score=52.18 TRINITY_DN6647_c0_g3_i11:486-1127(-)